MPVSARSLLELPASLDLFGPGRHEGAAAEGARARRLGHVMGVDGGATKTLAAILDPVSKEVWVGHGGPSNEDSVGAAAASEALLSAAAEAAARASVELDDLTLAVLAVAGTNTDAVAAHVRKRQPDRWIIVNDVVGAWATATGGGPGVGVISGTGSNVFGVGEDGRTWRAGGWGHILGDEGSAYWLGLHSLVAAVRHRDRSGAATGLTEALLEFYEVDEVQELVSLVYGKPLSKREIAAFAVEAARVAGAGDAVAVQLFHEGAAGLAAQIETVIAQTGLAGSFPVGLIGSTFNAGALLLQPLTAALAQAAPSAQVSVVEAAPVTGALLLALRAAGHEREITVEELDRAVAEAISEGKSAG